MVKRLPTLSLQASLLTALSPCLPDPVFCPEPLLSRKTGCLTHQGLFSGMDTPRHSGESVTLICQEAPGGQEPCLPQGSGFLV